MKNLRRMGIVLLFIFFEQLTARLVLAQVPSSRRVVSVHNSKASDWIGSDSGTPHDHLDQEEVNKMVKKGISMLTGKEDQAEAWSVLVPYQAGEAVAVKLNFNNAGEWDDEPWMNPYAELVNAIIDGLVGMGIPPAKIWLTDPSRVINDFFRARIINQEVLFVTDTHPGRRADGRERVINKPYVDVGSADATSVTYIEEGLTAIRPNQVFVEAAHLINVPQLKGHGKANISLGLKNHYGSAAVGSDTWGNRSYWHKYIYYVTGEPNPVIEINKNPHIKNKTRLIVGDGLYGNPVHNLSYPKISVSPRIWESFNNVNPRILFFGVDPVAVDSVMFDYMQRECEMAGHSDRDDGILKAAADAGLGVFEHWDGNQTRKYSLIDYIEVDLDLVQDTTIPQAPVNLEVQAG
jgi:hypothetical protein